MMSSLSCYTCTLEIQGSLSKSGCLIARLNNAALVPHHSMWGLSVRYVRGLQDNEGSLLIRYHYGRNSVRPIVPNCGRSGTELKAPLHASTPCSPITSDDHQ